MSWDKLSDFEGEQYEFHDLFIILCIIILLPRVVGTIEEQKCIVYKFGSVTEKCKLGITGQILGTQ
jgi:hypothetical protein